MLSSIYGVIGQNPEIYKNTSMKENMNYSIIKGGINNLTKQLAAYYGSSGIRINLYLFRRYHRSHQRLKKNKIKRL